MDRRFFVLLLFSSTLLFSCDRDYYLDNVRSAFETWEKSEEKKSLSENCVYDRNYYSCVYYYLFDYVDYSHVSYFMRLSFCFVIDNQTFVGFDDLYFDEFTEPKIIKNPNFSNANRWYNEHLYNGGTNYFLI